MKKIVLLLLSVFLVALPSVGQISTSQDGHLLLYGVRLGSTLQARKQNLVKNGFRYVKTYDGQLYYSGKFMGTTAYITLSHNRSSGRVTRISIIPDDYSEEDIRALESSLKSSLSGFLSCTLEEAGLDSEDISAFTPYFIEYVNRAGEGISFMYTIFRSVVSLSAKSNMSYEEVEELKRGSSAE